MMLEDFHISQTLGIRFSHVHVYVDHVKEIEEYKKIEDSINRFHHKFDSVNLQSKFLMDANRGKEILSSMEDISPAFEGYLSHGRDIVKQLITGFGFRVTGYYPPHGDTSTSNTVLVTSSDPTGIQIVVSSRCRCENDDVVDEKYLHFDRGECIKSRWNFVLLVEVISMNCFHLANIDRFYRAHSNRQGIAVLAFEVGPGCLQQIYLRYKTLHPQLIVEKYVEEVQSYEGEASILEVYAYYTGDKSISPADEGTILRFMETDTFCNDALCKLPGIVSTPAKFHLSCASAYFDHWVSNGKC